MASGLRGRKAERTVPLMKRRTFVRWAASTAGAWVSLPRWAWAQLVLPPAGPAVTLHHVAVVVLPSSLGATRLDAAVEQFERWIEEYRAGAEMSAGYGVTRPQTTAANPSIGYAAQLQALATAAEGQGTAFARLDPTVRASLVTAALNAAGIDALPRRPDGRHVATDLMSHFFFINDAGHDRLHDAAIERTRCRGLESSGERPANWSRG